MRFAVFAAILFSTVLRAETAPESTLYLVGEMRTTSPTGALLESSVAVIKRRVIPAERRIEITSHELKVDKSVAKRTTLMNVNGPEYVVTDPENSYKGTGAWFGKPWAWEHWKYEAKFANGYGGLEGDDHLSHHTLTIRKRYFDKSGKTTKLVHADMEMISQQAYEILVNKLK